MTISVFDGNIQKVLFKKNVENATSEEELIDICKAFLKETVGEVAPPPKMNDITTIPYSYSNIHVANTQRIIKHMTIDKGIFQSSKNNQIIMETAKKDLVDDILLELVRKNLIVFAMEECPMSYSYRISASLTVA